MHSRIRCQVSAFRSILAKPMILISVESFDRSCQSLKDLHPDESAADHYASLAAEILLQPLPPNTEEISLMRCQVHLMLGLFECCSGSERGWMLLGIALRQTQVRFFQRWLQFIADQLFIAPDSETRIRGRR